MGGLPTIGGTGKEMARKRSGTKEFDDFFTILDPWGSSKTDQPQETFGQEALKPYLARGEWAGGALAGPGGMLEEQYKDSLESRAYLRPQLRAESEQLKAYEQDYGRSVSSGLQNLGLRYGEMQKGYEPYIQETLKAGYTPTDSKIYEAQFGNMTEGIRASLAARGMGPGSGEGLAAEAEAAQGLSLGLMEKDFQRQQAALASATGAERELYGGRAALYGAEGAGRQAQMGMIQNIMQGQLTGEAGLAALQELPIKNYESIYGTGADMAKSMMQAQTAETMAKLQGKAGKGQGMGQLGGAYLAAIA